MVGRIQNGKLPYLHEKALRNKNSKNKKSISESYDKITISSFNKIKGGSALSDAQKAFNRRRIDFDSVVIYDEMAQIFTLSDGTEIRAEDVAYEINEDEFSPIQIIDNKIVMEPNTYGKWVDSDGNEHIVTVGENGVSDSSTVQRILSGSASISAKQAQQNSNQFSR